MGYALVDVTMVDSVHQCGKSESGRKGEEGRAVWTRGVDHQELWHLLVLRAFILPFLLLNPLSHGLLALLRVKKAIREWAWWV